MGYGRKAWTIEIRMKETMYGTKTEVSGLHKGNLSQFGTEVLKGLLSMPKRLNSKYFYDERGSALFREIMDLPEYYLTDCELDIFRNRSPEMGDIISEGGTGFDLIELGAGDGAKSKYLLRHLFQGPAEFTYMPIDISGSILDYLGSSLQGELPGLGVAAFQGEYLEMLAEACSRSTRRKVVLFLGANIGNMEYGECLAFCDQLHEILAPGDLVLIGFDLKKDPKQVLSAYNDPSGVTSRFNLNLLERINRELLANFVLDRFEHFPTYDPVSGSCRSYLVSKSEQWVDLGGHTFHFGKDEVIATEVSQKYDTAQIHRLAERSGFTTKAMFMDAKGWFVDAIWSIPSMESYKSGTR